MESKNKEEWEIGLKNYTNGQLFFRFAEQNHTPKDSQKTHKQKCKHVIVRLLKTNINRKY